MKYTKNTATGRIFKGKIEYCNWAGKRSIAGPFH